MKRTHKFWLEIGIFLFAVCFWARGAEAATFSVTSYYMFFGGHCEVDLDDYDGQTMAELVALGYASARTTTFTVGANKSVYIPGESMTVSYSLATNVIPSVFSYKVEYAQSYNIGSKILIGNTGLSSSKTTSAPNLSGNYYVRFFGGVQTVIQPPGCMSGDGTWNLSSVDVSYTVSNPTPAPTCSAFYSPSTINLGGQSSLRWNSTNATSGSYSCTNYSCSGSTCTYNGSGRSGALSSSQLNVTGGNVTWTGGSGADERCTFTFNGPGGSDSCSANLTINAPVAVNGSCGTAAKNYAYNATSYTGTFCSAGTPSPASPSFPAQGGSSSWTCLGQNGGTNSTCTSTRDSAPSAPTCSLSYSPSTITSGGSSTLSFSSTNATSASFSCTNYACSGSTCTYNGTGRSNTIATNGSATATWNDSGTGADETCTFTFTGPGGSKNCVATLNINSSSPPPSYSCSGSIPSGSTMCTSDNTGLTSTLAWQNVGTSSASCTATRKCEYYTPASPINGSCGPAATTYAYTATSFSGALCSLGNASPSSPSFPAQGSSTTWSCLGLNGGTNASCIARRNSAPAPSNNPPTAVIDTPSGNVTLPSSGGNVNFSGHGTDPDGDPITNYEWRVGNCSTGTLWSSANSFSRNFSAGPYTVYFRVRDSHGAWSTNCPSRTIRVESPMSVGSCGTAAKNYAYDATSYTGTFCSAGTASPLSPAFPAQGGARSWSCSTSHEPSSLVNCSATRDSVPAPSNKLPSAIINSPINGQTFTAGSSINFVGSGTDPDGDAITNYQWRFSSCSIGTAWSTSQSFSTSSITPGTYNVYLRVQDSHGAWSTNCPWVSFTVSPVGVTNGSCGTAAKNYAYDATSYTGTFCSAGTAFPLSPTFPAQGASRNWSCQGLNGGTNALCSASRDSAPCVPTYSCSVPSCGPGDCGTTKPSFCINQCTGNPETTDALCGGCTSLVCPACPIPSPSSGSGGNYIEVAP